MTAIEMRNIEAVEAHLLRAADELGRAKAREMELEDLRSLIKHDAVKRIMQTTNDLTGKPHSASSAEAVVESDDDYFNFRVKQREAVIDTQMAFARYECAKMYARLAGGAE